MNRWILLLTALLSCLPALAAEVRITLLQVNDVYQIAPVDRGTRGGLARVAGLRAAIARENPHTLLILAGDTLFPSVASNLFEGRQMIATWNAAGLDLAILGNHEFDRGPEVLRSRMRESRFPWLVTNVSEAGGAPFGGGLLRQVRDFGGIRVGFFGLLTPSTRHSSKPGADTRIDDPAISARAAIAALRQEGADIIVAITHLDLAEDQSLAHAAPGIDIILGGHEHSLLQSTAAGVPIFKMGSDARTLGRIDLFVDSTTRKLRHIDWSALPVDASSPEDPATRAVVADFERQISARLDQPVGETTVALNARQSDNRTRETNLGNFLADSYRERLGTDIALVNGGAIRSNTTYGPGRLTRRDILSVLPFENPVVSLRVRGAVLLQMLEHGLSQLEPGAEAGRFPQISGMRVRVDPRRPAGQRVLRVDIGSQPLDPAREYTLATPAFVAQGGDGYTMLRDQPYVMRLEDAPIEQEIIIERLQRQLRIAPATDGRLLASD